MNKKLLSLLEKSRFFEGSRERKHSLRIDIKGLEDFSFYLPDVFSSSNNRDKKDEVETFKIYLEIFLVKYLEEWSKPEINPNLNVDWKTFALDSLRFFKELSWKKIFNAIVVDKLCVPIKVNPNKSKFIVKKFGNMLALSAPLKVEGAGEEHKTGLRAIEKLCRDKDAYVRVSELIHEATVSIPLIIPRDNAGIGIGIDFKDIIDRLVISLPRMEWIDNKTWLDEILDYYVDETTFFLGKYCGLNVWGKIHHQSDGEKIRQGHSYNENTWRKGNIINREKFGIFTFTEDLELSLSVKSSLPEYFTSNNDNAFDFVEEQFQIAQVFSAIIAQLGLMQQNFWLKS